VGIPFNSTVSGIPPAGDQADVVISGTFVATGVSPEWIFYGAFNIVIYGNGGPDGAWDGSVQIERSFDGGTTWIVAGVGGAGAQAVYATATGADVSIVCMEPERGVAYRLHCTAYVSGTINYRMSATGIASTSNGIMG
jgi:hypothetical protein